LKVNDFARDNILEGGAGGVQSHRGETPEEVAQTIQRIAACVDPEPL
jgi:hypothetical protein